MSGCNSAPGTGSDPSQASMATPTVQSVDMGDYEVVLNWPKPLPDDDLLHDGWTWAQARAFLPRVRTRSGCRSVGRLSFRPAPSRGFVPACSTRGARTRAGGRTPGTTTAMTCGGITSCSPWIGRAMPSRSGSSTTRTLPRPGFWARRGGPRPAQALDEPLRSGEAHLDR